MYTTLGVLQSPLDSMHLSLLPLSLSLSLSLSLTTAASLLSILDDVQTPEGPSLAAILNGTAATVNSIQSVQNVIQGAAANVQQPHTPDELLEYVSHLADGGVLTLDVVSLLDGLEHSQINQPSSNPPPPVPLYPSQPGDAPYSVPEESLRASLYIPETFQYGDNGTFPVLLVPGTGGPTGTTYHYSFAQLAEAVPHADVAWLNIPNLTLEDAQVNAEYVAYAIHYLSAICASEDQPAANLAVISWSQGGLDVQWALKYWPSTRSLVSDFIPISPDFRGTVVRNAICPALNPLLCDPSVWQQGWDSRFVQALAADGGNSAYVPTTSVYSATDQIVQPQSGPNASAILMDERHVGVTTALVQEVCPGQPAGSVYTHEGVLYSPVAWALAVDALTHDGPADLSRVDWNVVCARFAAPQLQLHDVLGCEAALVIALGHFITHPHKVVREPELKPYALPSR